MKTTTNITYNLATAITLIALTAGFARPVAALADPPAAPAATTTDSAAGSTSTSSTGLPTIPAAPYTQRHPTDVTLDFVAADINDVLKALAVQTGANIVSSSDVKGSVTVSLAHVSLEQALDLITRISGFAYTKTGSTYLIGTAAAIAAVNPPATPEAKTPVTAVVAFTYANPDDLNAMLKNRFPDIKLSPGTSLNGAKAGTGAKALIITGDADTVQQVKDLILQVDAALGANVQESQTEVYTVHYAAMTDLINILNSLVPDLVITPGPSQGFGAKAPSAAASAASSSSSSTSTSSSSSGASGGAATGASQASETGPTVLLLTGSEVNIARGLDILNKVDVRPVQILYEAKVTELTNTAQHNIGLNWSFANATTNFGELNTGNKTVDVGTTAVPVVNPGNVFSIGTFGRTPVSDFATLSLDAMFQDGGAKLLADPNIAAVDGQSAQVFIGNTVNYISTITQTPTGQNITTASVQVGVTLRVTGKIDSDGFITLNIHPEVSTISQFLPMPGGGSLPEVDTRFADTTVRVHDGDTVAIGGLIQETDLTAVTSVPFFGQIPIFGSLFKDSQKTKNRDEVVFFLKTSIMKNS